MITARDEPRATVRWRAWAWLASFRRRILFRSVFLLLAFATIALAAALLEMERQRALESYERGFQKTREQISARLAHPAGQLALLNAARSDAAPLPPRPYVLPYSALDFDDASKAQQAVEMSGCLLQYAAQDAALCTAVGSNPWAGGFLYIVGRFATGPLAARDGARDLSAVHRLRVSIDTPDGREQWLAPFERERSAEVRPADRPAIERGAARYADRGRLAGFVAPADGADRLGLVTPNRDFRGWLWQSGQCLDGKLAVVDGAESGCPRVSFFSIRVPVARFQRALFSGSAPVWPPSDLDQIRVHVEAWAPPPAGKRFDSDQGNVTVPFALGELSGLLLPGESLQIRRLGSPERVVASLRGAGGDGVAAPWLERWLRRLPLGEFGAPLAANETVTTALGSYRVELTGDVRGLNKALAVVATRMSWFVGAMLGAILLAWVVIELGLIRRITALDRRAREVRNDVRGGAEVLASRFDDLRGKDELGNLGHALHDLLQRVNDDARRERVRVEQEKNQWQAVGHEIMSPLQSLMVLHGDSTDPSHRYVQRMQQAVRVLYGHASPSDAFQGTQAAVSALDLNAFLLQVVQNAPAIGIERVVYTPASAAIWVLADEFLLEDVITHVLQNAQRYRVPDSDISMRVSVVAEAAQLAIHDVGPYIAEDRLTRIFEYGETDASSSPQSSQRGQGLYVARTYMAKMGGNISAQNDDRGVEFVLTLATAHRSAA